MSEAANQVETQSEAVQTGPALPRKGRRYFSVNKTIAVNRVYVGAGAPSEEDQTQEWHNKHEADIDAGVFDWMDLRERISLPEYEKALLSGVTSSDDDSVFRLAVTLMYITDWSFESEPGVKLPRTLDTLLNADAELMSAIVPAWNRALVFLANRV